MTQELKYMQHILQGLQGALTKDTVQNLFEKHIKDIEKYNRKKKAIHCKIPCPDIPTFRLTHLPAILILKLQQSTYAGYLSNLSYSEIATLLGADLTKEALVQMETKIIRIMKHPTNRHLVYDMQDTARSMTSPKTTDLTVF